MKQSSTVNFFLFVLGFLMPPLQGFAENLTALNYAEAGLAIARGPLAALSYRNQGNQARVAKTIHIATDVTRLANKVLTLINHPEYSDYSSFFWTIFDASNLYIDIAGNNKKSDDTVELSEAQEQSINQLVQITQTYLLPLVESSTALYQALNIDSSLENHIYRQQVQAFESLARATSVYLNHQKSKMAILLLIGTIAETFRVLNLKTAPHQPNNNQPNNNQPNNNQPNGLQLGHFAQVDQFRRDDAANRELFRANAQNPPIIRLEPRIDHDRNELVDHLIIQRNGQELALNQDAITRGDWEAGDRVRIFACNHATLEDNIAPMQQAAIEQQEILVLDLGYIRHTCHLCQRIRVPELERIMVIP